MMKKKIFLWAAIAFLALFVFDLNVSAESTPVRLFLAPSEATYPEGQIPDRGANICYRSLKDVLLVACAGDEIVLREDISGIENETMKVTQSTLTIDLNGFAYLNQVNKREMIQIIGGANLTVLDRRGNGVIHGTICQACVKVMPEGSLTLISGEVINDRSSFYGIINSGSTKILGGKISGKKVAVYSGGANRSPNAETLIYDGTLFSNSRSAVLLSSGIVDVFGGYFQVPSGRTVFQPDGVSPEQLRIKGGYYSANVSSDIISEDYVCEINTDPVSSKSYPYKVSTRKIVRITALSGMVATDGTPDFSTSPGRVLGSGSYYIGDQVSLTAPKIQGLKFSGWYRKTDEEWQKIFSETCPTLIFEAEFNGLWAAGYCEEDEEPVTLEIQGKHFTLTETGDPQKDGEYENACQINCPFGTKLTIASNNTDHFLYWIDESGKIISDKSAFSFSLCKDTSILEISMQDDSGQTALLFFSNYKQVISYGFEDGNDPVVFPEIQPFGTGKIFRGWRLKNGSECLSEEDVREIIQDTHLRSMEMTSDEISSGQTCDVTLNYPETQQEQKYEVLPKGREQSLKVDSKAIPSGKVFGYWCDERGRIQNYAQEFSLRVVRDQTLTGRFFTEGDTVTAIPVLSFQNCAIDEQGSRQVVRFALARSIPEDFELLDLGFIVATDKVTNMTLDSPNVRIITSPDRKKNGSLTGNYHINDSVMSQNLYCRGYMAVEKEGEKYIIYSEIRQFPLKK